MCSTTIVLRPMEIVRTQLRERHQRYGGISVHPIVKGGRMKRPLRCARIVATNAQPSQVG